MFALRVFALIIALAMMTGGFCGAAGSQRMLDLAERRQSGDETVDAGTLQEYVRELVLQRTFGYGVLVVGGMVFLWICFGLVKKGSLTRRPGVVVVVLMGGIVCFMTYRAVVNTRRIKEVGDQHRGEIEARANAKVARIYYEARDGLAITATLSGTSRKSWSARIWSSCGMSSGGMACWPTVT